MHDSNGLRGARITTSVHSTEVGDCDRGEEMTVGLLIRSAREQAGLSIADVAAATRMRASIIEAMEADDFSLCGGAVYARGQLRMMAPIIGLDPEDLASSFDAQSPELDY